MVHSLEEAKQVVSRNYLRRGGIHGVGMLPDDNAITVYAESPDQQLIQRIRNEVEPYRVNVISAPMPSLAEQRRVGR